MYARYSEKLQKYAKKKLLAHAFLFFTMYPAHSRVGLKLETQCKDTPFSLRLLLTFSQFSRALRVDWNSSCHIYSPATTIVRFQFILYTGQKWIIFCMMIASGLEILIFYLGFIVVFIIVSLKKIKNEKLLKIPITTGWK